MSNISHCNYLLACFNFDINESFGSPDLDDTFERISWDLYHIQYGSPKTRAAMFHQLNKVIPTIIDDMTVFERTELIRLILNQQDRRKRLGVDGFPLADITLLSLQSEEVNETEPGTHAADAAGSASSGDLEVTVRYLDENPGSLIKFNPIRDNTYYSDYVPDSDIQNFLSRPLVIQSIAWTEGTHLNVNIEPWDLFFNSTQVKKKIDNFQWISCNLHIKVVLNASPFYYGAALASYHPLPAFTPSTIFSGFTNNTAQALSGLSTRPHFWIYPQTNQGGELVAPFFFHKNWIPVNSRQAFRDMGQFAIRSATGLLNANSVAGNDVTLTVFAWASDVRLHGPTLNLALQADEYDGPVSKVASNVSKVSRALERVPMIGPFAKATTMISSGIANLSSLFGFTNVPNIEPVCPYKSLPFHSFATTEISAPIEKLTLDPKQELSIDNRITGIGPDDEMLISNIIQRDCLLNISTWGAANIVGDFICRGNVLPYHVNQQNINGVSAVQGTPISHISCLFKAWRGDIIFRFRFICSKFHRGRAVVQWDPDGDIYASNPATNVVYSQIIDISEETDVEFRVPYMQATPWQNTYVADDPSVSRIGNVNFVAGAGALPAYEAYTMNGRITMRVLTRQTSPVASADIVVLTSIRAADNLEFANPVNPPQRTSFLDLQSEVVEYNAPQQYCISDKPLVVDENRYLVNFGEQIRSIRQLIRRTTFSRGQFFGTNTTSLLYLYISIHSPIPLYRGYLNVNGINSAVGTVDPLNNFPFNFVSVTPINWLMPCYIGYRGGFNWHYNVNSPAFVDNLKAARRPQAQVVVDYNTSTILATGLTSSARARFLALAYENGAHGMSVQNQKTQTGLSVYYPMYTRFRFMTTNPKAVNLGTTEDESNKERCKFECTIKPTSSSVDIVQVSNADYYVGAGTDLSFIFFLNVPSMYVYETPAAN